MDSPQQAVWSVVFAQELLVASAVIIVLLASSLAMAVIGLARFKHTEKCGCVSFVAVHFPIGLHGGWVLAGERLNDSFVLSSVGHCALGPPPCWQLL